MKKLWIGLLLLLFSGCVSDSVVGSYTQNDSVLILRDDNTYLYKPTNSSVAQKGAWSQTNNIIEITNILGMTTSLTILNGGLLDDENQVWKKSD